MAVLVIVADGQSDTAQRITRANRAFAAVCVREIHMAIATAPPRKKYSMKRPGSACLSSGRCNAALHGRARLGCPATCSTGPSAARQTKNRKAARSFAANVPSPQRRTTQSESELVYLQTRHF